MGGVVVTRLPLYLLLSALANLANLVAPGLVFKMVQRAQKGMEGKPNALSKEMVRSTKDMAFLFSFDIIKMKIGNKIRDILKTAQEGELAPSPELVDLETRAKVPLLSLARAGRPLVLNFGSCT